MRQPMSVVNLAEIRAKRRAASVATAVLLTIIQDRLIGYFHTDAGNPATDVQLGAAGLLCLSDLSGQRASYKTRKANDEKG